MPADRQPPWRMPTRVLLVACHDVFMAAFSFELAVWLRYWAYGLPQPFFFVAEGTLLFALVAGLVFWWIGLYRGIWYYASSADLIAILKGATLAILIFVPLLFLVTRLENVPRTAFLAQWPILILLLAGPRFFYQMLKGRSVASLLESATDGTRVPVLLIGAGDAADTFIREMARSPTAPYRVVGIVDDKVSRIGREMRGVRVEGSIADLPAVVERLEARGQRPQRLVIAAERIEGAGVRRLLDLAEPLGLGLARLPRLTEFRREGEDAAAATRPIDVEDLLQRPQRGLDREAMRRLVEGKRVLVTGAGGTIGGELARQIADLGPAHLALLDLGEYALYAIDLEIGERRPALARSAHLVDVAIAPRVEAAFRKLRPELVFHAAALKHVPIVEDHPIEGIRANVLGTRNVADACVAHDAEAMVLISTDKAVNPSSAMGATKRVAEMYCQSLSLGGGATRFVTVRFGNVLGSTGSVVPLFQRQIARGGPITVTHPEMTRYFMTVREAVELVLQASASASSAAGDIVVLDMGEPVKIVDLARQMARLAGLRPQKDIQIAFTGLRPGEKLAETLFHEAEPPRATAVDGLLLAHPRVVDFDVMTAALDRIGAAILAGRNADAIGVLRGLVPEYNTPEHNNG